MRETEINGPTARIAFFGSKHERTSRVAPKRMRLQYTIVFAHRVISIESAVKSRSEVVFFYRLRNIDACLLPLKKKKTTDTPKN